MDTINRDTLAGAASFVAISGATFALLERFKGPARQLREIAALHEEAILLAGPQMDWLSWIESVVADVKHPLHARVLSSPVPLTDLSERWFHADLLDAQGALVRHADELYGESLSWIQDLTQIAKNRRHPLHSDWHKSLHLFHRFCEEDIMDSLQKLAQLLRDEKLRNRLPVDILPLSRAYWRWLLA